ncbi:MAG: T9SS type A sorting domain-containing protein [Flavobacterium sp.]|uniref:T9SS type A sorting domain-containing protein n=1 Tax=Flavobacterium sp. TaxID=239 RepID=UPI003266C62D
MKKIILIIILFCVPKLMAQQTTNASGGNASGAGGNSSYAIGQVVYTTQTGATGIVTQGVEQPFEIVTLSGAEFTNIKLEAIIYPNPTTVNVTLKISDFDLENLNYQLYDIQGKLINEGKISNEETILNMGSYSKSTYILKVNSATKELKTFKIIKN